MTDAIDRHASCDAEQTLRIERLLPGSLERVWAWLTEPALRAKWLADGPMEPRVGGRAELVWRNDDLAPPPAERPEGVPAENRMSCTITAWEPPQRLGFTWAGSGGVTFDLAPRGDRVLLTMTHARVEKRSSLLATAAGWHTHLDILEAVAEGRTPPRFWPSWTQLRTTYEALLPG